MKEEYIPTIIIEKGDRYNLSVIENLQREPLNPMEEAWAFQRMREKDEKTYEEIAGIMVRSVGYVAQRVVLLRLDKQVQDMVYNGRLPCYTAAHLCQFAHNEQIKIARGLVDGKMTAAQAFAYIEKLKIQARV